MSDIAIRSGAFKADLWPRAHLLDILLPLAILCISDSNVGYNYGNSSSLSNEVGELILATASSSPVIASLNHFTAFLEYPASHFLRLRRRYIAVLVFLKTDIISWPYLYRVQR